MNEQISLENVAVLGHEVLYYCSTKKFYNLFSTLNSSKLFFFILLTYQMGADGGLIKVLLQLQKYNKQPNF